MDRTPRPATRPCDGIDIEDKNIKVVFLTSGKYLIDGEVVNVSGYGDVKVQVVDATNIRKITENNFVKEYACGYERLTVRQYDEQRIYLLSKRTHNDDYDEEWESLEDEFAYRKFMQMWTPIYTLKQEISEPLLVQFEKTKYDTGNEYIRNAFLNGDDKEVTLFTYNQDAAWLGIVRECFNELEMSYQEGLSYSATNNKKVWSNSSNGCIRYVTAFGTYVFNDVWKNPRVLKGTLKDMIKKYESDREAIRRVIIDQYNNHFGCIDAGKFDFDRLKSIISRAQSNLSDVEPKQKSYKSWNFARNALNEAQEMIKVAYEVKK